MQRVLPTLIIMGGVELGDYVITILVELLMQSYGVCGAADKAVVAFSPYPRVNYLLHISFFVFVLVEEAADLVRGGLAEWFFQYLHVLDLEEMAHL